MNSGFNDVLYLPGDEELDVRVEWEGDYQPAKTTGRPEDCYPSDSEMDVDVQVLGEWPEGLSREEFDRLVREQYDRFIDHAWDDYWEKLDELRNGDY